MARPDRHREYSVTTRVVDNQAHVLEFVIRSSDRPLICYVDVPVFAATMGVDCDFPPPVVI